jgi:P-type E1-E2 ATPase
MLLPDRVPVTSPRLRSRRSWWETADCSMPIASASSVTAQGASRSLVRISRRLGAVAEMEDSGQTAAVVLLDSTPVALLGIADRTRPAAPAAIADITAVTGTAPILLTGDNAPAARRLAAQVGICDVRAGLLPQDKAAAVHELEAAGERVLLVGDGINDAPALAAAQTGVAMGRAGSDLALDTADAVIMRDDLSTIPAVIMLSRQARRVVAANLAIAAAIITGLVIWDLAGHLPLPLGVAGHEGSTVIVGLNGLRLLRAGAWRGGHRGRSSPTRSAREGC